MKKSIIKKFSSKALAAATGTAVMMSAYAPTLASAAEEGTLYISEVYLSYGDTPDKAKQWLEDNDFTVLDQDLNEDAEGGVSFLGLGSEERCVYLGYKTTTDKDEAITDMRAMNMNGNFSYDDYEKLLQDKKSQISAFVADMKIALAEYRENYEKGDARAKLAHDKLDQLLDDDCDFAGLGELLLQPTKEEMTEEEYKAAPKQHADMTTLVLQGNVNNVNTLMTDLAIAADTSSNSWISRIKDSKGIDGIFDRFEKEYPGLSESAITNLIVSEYDDQAKVLANKLVSLKESMKAYTDCSVKSEDSEDKVKAYFEEHTDESVGTWSLAGTQYTILSDVKYGEGTLYDLLDTEKIDYSNTDDRMALYPILEAMSPGQRALLSYVELGDLIITGNLDDKGWESAAKEAQETIKTTAPGSVYLGVDRSVFDPAGVALTSEARQLQSATGSSYSARLFGEYSSYYEIAAITTSVVMLGVGIGSLVHAGSLKTAAEELTREARTAANNLNEKTAVIADKFCDYLKSQKVTFVKLADNTDIVIESLTSNPQMKKKLFEAFSNPAGSKQLMVNIRKIKDNGAESMNRMFVTPNKYYKHFTKKSDYKSVVDEYNTALEEVTSEAKVIERNQNQAHAEWLAERSSKWQIAGAVLCIAGALLAVGSAVVTVYDFYQYYHQDYTSIPRIIVHESSDDMGRFNYTVYNCTLCNRAEQGFANDTLGEYGDMNGDVGKQWVALYTTKDKAAGDEITADIIAQKGSNKFPSDKGTTVRLFGKTDSLNIVSEDYGYNDKLGGLYIFSGTVKDEDAPEEQPAETDDNSTPDTASEAETVSGAESAADTSSEAAAPTEDSSGKEEAAATGSVVGTGVMIGSCVGSAALGALVCFLIIRMKRKESAA